MRPRPDAGFGRRLTRRGAIGLGLGGLAGIVVAGAAGTELVASGVLPGHQFLDQIDGACTVAAPPMVFGTSGHSMSGTFYSAARRRRVGYTIAYPPGHGPGSRLPLIVALHAYGGSHRSALSGMSLAQGMALRVGGRPLPRMAIAAADGGGGYWNPHPGDNPMAMITDELIPRCQRLGLGTGHRSIGAFGISMGGYGALLLAEQHPEMVAAVAAVAPAIWTSYAQARAVNPGAYASARAFAAADAVTHAPALATVAVRVASGLSDPFHPGVAALARSLPPDAVVRFVPGCHTRSFFVAQEPASLSFLGAHLAGRA